MGPLPPFILKSWPPTNRYQAGSFDRTSLPSVVAANRSTSIEKTSGLRGMGSEACGRPRTKSPTYIGHVRMRSECQTVDARVEVGNELAPVAERMRQRTSNPYHAGSNPAGGAV